MALLPVEQRATRTQLATLGKLVERYRADEARNGDEWLALHVAEHGPLTREHADALIAELRANHQPEPPLRDTGERVGLWGH